MTALRERLDLSTLISKFETVFPGDGVNYPDPGDLCTVHYTARVVGTTDIMESRCVRAWTVVGGVRARAGRGEGGGDVRADV